MLHIKDADEAQFAIIKSWNKTRWNKAAKVLTGIADMELLDKLAGMVRLPAPIEARRSAMHELQDAVDRERMNADPKPLFDYPVRVPLYKHQIRGANMAAMVFGFGSRKTEEPINKGFGLLFEMGCGKTLTAIAIIGAGYKRGLIKKVMIAAPASVCAVWQKEFQEYADFKFTVRTLLGTKAQRIKALDDLEAFPFEALKVAVINYESTWRDGLYERLAEFDADLIIADESQRIKTHDAAQSKAMHRLGDRARYKLILSGTPIQNEAVDIFSQYRFLDSTVFGTNFYTFRSRYCVMGGFNRKQIVQYRDLDQLIKKEHSIAYRVTKSEAIDLPAQTFENRYITLDPKERKLYDRLRRESVAELDGGGKVTASTVLTKLLRLQQFTGGFLTEDEAHEPKLISRGKLDALADILEDYVVEGKKKLVIFARFLPEVTEIAKLAESVLTKHGMKAVSIYGAIPKEQRGEIVRQFQTDPNTTVFIGQIDTAGTGITLTAADTCVYYSVSFNYAAYSQSLSRIHRIGQSHPCTYIHLVAENTVDSTILDALTKKEDLAKAVVDDWRQFFN